MSTRTYKFQRVEYRAAKKGDCPRCGKRVSRCRTFYQTINPLNLNAQDEPKTWAEIDAELRNQAAGWMPDFEHSYACASLETTR